MNVEALLSQVKKPGRYCGNEFNVIKKDWDRAEVRLALAFPDLYEIGMSHQGLRILYHILNSRREFLAERVYAPDRDLEDLLREQDAPLFSLESRRPLADFDILGITLPYELCYANILTILSLAGLPFRSADRDESHPLVLGGGPCAFHPEPVADFFDAILLGDGEEAILEIAETVGRAKKDSAGRGQVLARLAEIPGVYVPAFFAPHYGTDGAFQGMRPLRPGYEKVRRRILPDLDKAIEITEPLVPASRIVHDRLGVEIARGCTRGCRFCQAGISYRPVRERAPDKILALAKAGIEQGGFEELALLSLSTGDYSCISDLLVRMMDAFAKERVSVSMPSMRVGTLTPEIMAQIRRVRKTGFTLAPEAGTDRLRRVLNKGISEADLLATSEAAYSLGWKVIKLYFMFGLPTETEEDLAAIPALVRKVLHTAKGGGQVTASAAAFVPKPHTPFEREPQLGIDQGFARIDFLKAHLKGRGFKLKWHDPRQSFLEGVLSRGDRRLARVLETAWLAGARLDAWSDHFDLARWQRAAQDCGLDLASYLRRRRPDEPLPWQHLKVGVDDDFLKTELEKAGQEIYTPDCRVHGCQSCGVCDFKTVKPIVVLGKGESGRRQAGGQEAVPAPGPTEDAETVRDGRHFLYRCTYAKMAEARFLSHLELMQVLFRAFRRARVPLHFSQGFHPTPKVSFGPALPLGTESLAEHLIIDLEEPLQDMERCRARINAQLPAGITVTGIGKAVKEQAAKTLACYRITVSVPPDARPLERLLKSEQFIITVQRKKGDRHVDVRPLVQSAALDRDGILECVLLSEAGRPGVKPMEIVGALFGLSPQETQRARIRKIWQKETQ